MLQFPFETVHSTDLLGLTSDKLFYDAGTQTHEARSLSSSHLFVMAALRSRCGHYILPLWFLLLSFSSPILSGRRLDIYTVSYFYT